MAEIVEQERGFSPQAAQEPGLRVAHIVSVITNPLFVALPVIFLVAWRTAPDIWRALLWWAVVAGGLSLAPFLFILRGVRRGQYSDQHLSVREQRLVPLLFGIACIILVFALLLLMRVSRALLAIMVAVLIVCILTLAITRYWKISLHLVGIAGAVVGLVLVLSPLCLLLTPLVVLVGWARWRVRAHTIPQALAGTLLAVCVTVSVFFLFGTR
jgi:hypothetical protein